MACFIPSGQRVVVFGLDFDFIRILVLVGWFRIIIKNEIVELEINNLDKSIIVWAVIQTIVYVIQQGSISGFVYRLGTSFDSIGMYFLFRIFVKTKKDIHFIVKTFIYISFVVLFFFIIERLTRRNFFSIFGGVPEITRIREGKLRIQGAYAHPILAGAFWAVLLPFFFAELYQTYISKRLVVLGLLSSGFIIVLSNSSTPILSVIFGVLGFAFIIMRNNMKAVRILAVLGYIFLDLIMEAPAYHLISRIDISGGSTGYHRYHLINQAVHHWKEWLFFGVKTIDSWNVFKNDITNQYILLVVEGGILNLLAFIVILFIFYQYIGDFWRTEKYDKKEIIFFWSIGVSLFMHLSNFIAVSYFGQIWVVWYLTLAFVGSLYQHLKENEFVSKDNIIFRS